METTTMLEIYQKHKEQGRVTCSDGVADADGVTWITRPELPPIVTALIAGGGAPSDSRCSAVNSGFGGPVTHPTSVLNAAVEAATKDATQAERARIRAELQKLEPIAEPYSRRDWALEQKGAREMFAKVMRLFDAPTEQKGGE